MQMSRERLRPCPLCGTTDLRLVEKHGGWFVEHVGGPACAPPIGGLDREDKMVWAWNGRGWYESLIPGSTPP